MNTVYLLGNLGNRAEVRRTNSGQDVAEATVATNKNFKVGNDWQQKTTWHKVVAFGKNASRMSLLEKGEMVLIVGEIVVETWTKDGQSRSATKVYADKIVRASEIRLDSGQPQARSQPDYETPPF